MEKEKLSVVRGPGFSLVRTHSTTTVLQLGSNRMENAQTVDKWFIQKMKSAWKIQMKFILGISRFHFCFQDKGREKIYMSYSIKTMNLIQTLELSDKKTVRMIKNFSQFAIYLVFFKHK